jgi:hypothetical protein
MRADFHRLQRQDETDKRAPVFLCTLTLAHFDNKLATTLALSTQCGYNANWRGVNLKHLQSKVFQRQPSVIAMSRGRRETRFESWIPSDSVAIEQHTNGLRGRYQDSIDHAAVGGQAHFRNTDRRRSARAAVRPLRGPAASSVVARRFPRGYHLPVMSDVCQANWRKIDKQSVPRARSF